MGTENKEQQVDELIAEEIEDPFGNDSNDLPMEKIASNIKMHVEEII
jgi:putative membrane protein